MTGEKADGDGVVAARCVGRLAGLAGLRDLKLSPDDGPCASWAALGNGAQHHHRVLSEHETNHGQYSDLSSSIESSHLSTCFHIFSQPLSAMTLMASNVMCDAHQRSYPDEMLAIIDHYNQGRNLSCFIELFLHPPN